ncbi:MAG: HIT domain-containing protein [Chloroflexota bacterium]
MKKKWLWHPWVRTCIGWVFERMSFAIPVRRLHETDTLLAFHHPNPSHPFHVLLVPKKAVTRLADLDPADTAFLSDLYAVVQSLVHEYQLPAYRLIVNGGEFQDFPQLHFHLVASAAGSGTKEEHPVMPPGA